MDIDLLIGSFCVSRTAIKVVRSVKRYLDAAYVEIEILEKLKAADPKRKS